MSKAFNTIAEIYQHLLGGGKLGSEAYPRSLDKDEYIHLVGGAIVHSGGRHTTWTFATPENWHPYKGPLQTFATIQDALPFLRDGGTVERRYAGDMRAAIKGGRLALTECDVRGNWYPCYRVTPTASFLTDGWVEVRS